MCIRDRVQIDIQQFHLVATPSSSSSNTQLNYWTFWIDYNQDGDFNDNFEFVGYGRSTGSITGYVTIPNSVSNGDKRLRCIMSTSHYVLNTCTTYSNGETEDYTLSITKNQNYADNSISRRERTETGPIDLSESSNTQVDELLVYPNPVSEVLTVNVADISGVESIRLINTNGQSIESILDIKQNNKLSIVDQPDGIYLLIVYYANGQHLAKKIVVQHLSLIHI